MMTRKKIYLGDGLYAHFDGFQFWLTAPREGGDHEVALDSQTLEAFLKFVEKSWGVKITVEKVKPEPEDAV